MSTILPGWLGVVFLKVFDIPEMWEPSSVHCFEMISASSVDFDDSVWSFPIWAQFSLNGVSCG